MDDRNFSSVAVFDRILDTLRGILDGISADGKINQAESEYVKRWLSENSPFANVNPIKQIYLKLSEALSDGILTQDEVDDIQHLISVLRSDYINQLTYSMRKLFGIMAGINADKSLNEQEYNYLKEWALDKTELQGYWPYDEVISLCMNAKKTEDGFKILNDFITQLSVVPDSAMEFSNHPQTVLSVCAVDPQISFEDSIFCFTGKSEKYSRKELEEKVISQGGKVTRGFTNSVTHLVICALRSEYYAYSLYGKKIEIAIKHRKKGGRVFIIHENDFLDALP